MSTHFQPTPETTPYELLGGEVVVKRIVKRFYELMDTLPETYAIRQLHPENLAGSEQKLFMFLSGWLGGPPLYVEQFGHPRLRARHLPFPIASAEAAQWMLCMRQALHETVIDQGLRNWLENALSDLALHMRNRADAPAA